MRPAMRPCLSAVLLSGFATAAMLQTAAVASAADLTVTRSKRVAIVHHRSRVVADYDGTPIVLRRTRPVVVRGLDGAVVVERGLYEAHWVPGAIPLTYLNGQRVR
jgi:hypothetical protein